MPLRVLRRRFAGRSLGVEIGVALALKALALAAIGLILFGPQDRPRPAPERIIGGGSP
ncbi:MAG: hypothetical protein ACM33T_11275 [Solirubrobacterales bacterium]